MKLVLPLVAACAANVYRPAAPRANCAGCSRTVAPGSVITVYTSWQGICWGAERRSFESGNVVRPTYPCEQHAFTVQVECAGCDWKAEYFDGGHSDGMVHVHVPDHLGPFAFTLRMHSGHDEHGWRSPQFNVAPATAPFDPTLTDR